MKDEIRDYASKLVCAAWILIVAPVAAQEFAVDWFSIDGGGGVSSGGGYAISGIIGQPDAGVMSGGEFALEGGFWGVIAPIANFAGSMVRILVTSTNTLVLVWPNNPPGFRLLESADLTRGDWSEVTEPALQVGGDNQVIVTPSVGNRFYRLLHPVEN